MTYFYFNKLYVLQSLSPNDFALGYNQPNNNLIMTIESIKRQNRNLGWFNYELITIDLGENQFINVTERIITECLHNNIYPIIHFLGHGEKDNGIYIWNNNNAEYDCIVWRDLFMYLANINKSCHNNLFFTTTACHGFDSFKQLFIEELKIIPIVGIVAIDPNEEFYVNDADIIFCEFYKTLLITRSISQAFSIVNELKPKLIGKSPYVAFSDIWFVKAYKMAADKCYIKKNVKKIISKNLVCWPDKLKRKTLSDYMKEIEVQRQLDYIHIRNQKFMFDDPKVEKARFDLPDRI